MFVFQREKRKRLAWIRVHEVLIRTTGNKKHEHSGEKRRGEKRMGRMEQLRSWWNARPGKEKKADAGAGAQARETFSLSNAGQIAFWLGSEAIECAG
jgi:hypothetical protein